MTSDTLKELKRHGLGKYPFLTQSKIELTTSAEDWITIRECYVKSFLRYPLYKYMVPDQSKREEFLRAYLDANYDVTVGSGQGILLAIKVLVGSGEEAYYKVVGGVVFVPPSSDGCGWAIGSDEPYWEAYEKHQLSKISAEGLERVKRYEAWENDNIAQKLSGARIPLWNGLFCAIDPDYTSKGVGSAVYKEAIRIMAKYWIKQQSSSRVNSQTAPKCQEKTEDKGFFSKLFRNTSFSDLTRFSLLHHRGLPSAAFAQKSAEKSTKTSKKSQNTNSTQSNTLSLKDMMCNPESPLVVAVSHSDRAARFHQSNGFEPVSRLPFHDAVEGTTPFYTHVLVLDPFRTGRLYELTAGLCADSKQSCNETLPDIYGQLKSVNSSRILI